MEEKLRFIEGAEVGLAVENVMGNHTDGIRNLRSIETAIDAMSLDHCHFRRNNQSLRLTLPLALVEPEGRLKILDGPDELTMESAT